MSDCQTVKLVTCGESRTEECQRSTVQTLFAYIANAHGIITTLTHLGSEPASRLSNPDNAEVSLAFDR